MAFFIGLLTFVMVLDCVVLILLVLIQLPKKEAGAGVAFGGAATDALFGAGSGNVLTKATKYSATVFFVLAVVLSIMQSHFYHRGSTKFRENVESAAPLTAPAPAPAPAAPAVTPVTNNLNFLEMTPPPANSSNAPKK